jgi:fructose-1,6-bisphosphatase/inositol monophosphatase family enzyme
MMITELASIASAVREKVLSLPVTTDFGAELCMGADGTPTSLIDKIAEDVILQKLDELGLDLNVLSEEAGFIDRGGKQTLVMDPVDGTFNCIIGLPIYTVSLAVGTNSLKDIEHAYVQNIVTGDEYRASKGRGAFKNGMRIQVKTMSGARGVILMYVGRYAAPRTYKAAKACARARSFGCSSLEMCLVAEGKADAFLLDCELYEKSIRVVDIAASALILREAGGKLIDLEGKDLDMPFDLATRSNFLAYGDERMREALL